MKRAPKPVSLISGEITLLITDLDDTIWKWFDVWHASFSAMLKEVERVTGIPQETLIPEIKKVHQRHHTTEYTRVLEELPSLRRHFGKGFNAELELDSAIHRYRSARKRTFALYPTVGESLRRLKRKGVRIVAFTESQQFRTVQRILHGKLDGIIDVVYATEESHLVSADEFLKARSLGQTAYVLRKTQLRVLPHGLRKPRPEVLLDILKDEKCRPENAIYVGDTLSKDIRMAGLAGVLSAHAKYGETHNQKGYELIKAVTHWTAKEVREQAKFAKLPSHEPNFTLRKFEDLLGMVRFGRS